MKVLVTGGSGFIGTNMINLLLKEGSFDILNIDMKSPQNKDHAKYWCKCDILDLSALKKVISDFKPQWVIHLAAKTGLTRPKLECYAENMAGVENMIEAMSAAGSVERAIFTSTLLVCQMGYIPKHDTDYKPNTLYGESKMLGEQIVRKQKDLKYDWLIIRPISIWGPWGDEPYINFFRSISRGWYLHIGSGSYRRSLGYVENAVYEIYKLLLAPKDKFAGKTYYIADYEPANLHSMAEEIKQQLGARRIFHLPLLPITIIAKVGDVLRKLGWENVPLQSFRLNNILTEYVFDMSKLSDVVGKTPFTLKEGIARTIAWLKKHKHV